MKFFNFSNTTSPPTADLLTKKLLGRGKYSVHQGKILSRNQDCAIKIYPNTTSAQNAYNREKRVISSLKHPHLVSFISHQKDKDDNQNSLLLMEFAPYGDFFDLIMSRELTNECFIRTYFTQLVEGIEYLHSMGIAHLDLKLDNLLLGRNYLLKITDFDLAHSIRETTKPLSRGTSGYRAPEVWNEDFQDVFAADVYSLGVILFICVVGEFPFVERELNGAKDLGDYDLFDEINECFWHKKSMQYNMEFDENLKELFNGICAKDVQKRFTLGQIKKSKWYQGEILEGGDLIDEMETIYEKVSDSIMG